MIIVSTAILPSASSVPWILQVLARNLHMLYCFVVAAKDVSIFFLDLTSRKWGTKSSIMVIIAQPCSCKITTLLPFEWLLSFPFAPRYLDEA
jgi:hypothetical protein